MMRRPASSPDQQPSRRPNRVRQRHVEWTADRLTDRDRAIVSTVHRLRLTTGQQLERLHFTDLTGRSRAVVRWRVLKRLTDWRVLMPLPRRVGGADYGSSGHRYALDSTGQALMRLQTTGRADTTHTRRPGLPGERFVAHTLDVAELYVRLTEDARTGAFTLTGFDAEPDCWVPNGLGGWLKPDAYAVLAAETYDDAWWIEVDRATEHLTTLRRKLSTYLDFAARGQLGPDDVLPRVLVTVPDERRCNAVADLCDGLPAPADKLLHVAVFADAPRYLADVLNLPE